VVPSILGAVATPKVASPCVNSGRKPGAEGFGGDGLALLAG